MSDRVEGPRHGRISWSWNGVFTGEQSRKIACAGDSDETQRVAFPAEAGRLQVRFDFAPAMGVLEISSVVLRHLAKSEPLLELRTSADWRKIALPPGLVRVADSPALRLLVLDAEPQLTLPAVRVGESGGTIECEIRARLRPGLPALAEATREARIASLETTASKLSSQRLAAIGDAIARAIEAEKFAAPHGIGSLLRPLFFREGKRGKAPEFRCQIDTPAEGSSVPRSGCIVGWIFSTSGSPFFAVRARTGERTWKGASFLHRPDVGEAIPAAGDWCGFEIAYEFPDLGTHEVFIEAITSSGVWVQIAQRTFTLGATPDHAKVGYAEWLGKNSAASTPAEPVQDAQGPLISVLLAVSDPSEDFLRRAIDSVRVQTYRNWELCLAAASTPPHVRPMLDAFAASDARIKVVHCESAARISAASNSALELATGEFAALLAADDELAPTALAEVANAIALHPSANCIYSDEDKIDADGSRRDPFFKPVWQPDFFLGQNYLAHLTVFRTRLMREAGGFRAACEGSHEWDLALRITERLPEASIVHLPRVLYHRRVEEIFAATGASENDDPLDAERHALADHLQRTGQTAKLIALPGGCWRVRYQLPAEPPKVSIIIPTRNGAELLSRCVESLLAKTAYPAFEIIVVDNGSDSADALACLDALRGRGVKVIRDPAPFNFSALNNRAVAHASGTVLAFLNNDLEVIGADWLAEMVSQAIRSGVGAVGAMLYYPDDRVQHAGVVLGINGNPHAPGVASHVLTLLPRGSDGCFHHLRLVKNYTAVTAACMVIRREIFEQIGGFNETDLAVTFNDVDFCLRVRAAGYRNVWTPFAELYHHESASRGRDTTPEKTARIERESRYMREKWGALLDNDPAYNPNLTLVRGDFGLAWPPRPVAPARAGNPFQSATAPAGSPTAARSC